MTTPPPPDPAFDVRARAGAAIPLIVIGVALVWAVCDGRPLPATAPLYGAIAVALVLPFVVGTVRQARNPTDAAARDILCAASILLTALMVLGTVARCASSVSMVQGTSDIARGGGTFIFGPLFFLASPWTFLFVPGVPLLFILRSLMKVTRSMPVDESRASAAATAMTFGASAAALLVVIPFWSSAATRVDAPRGYVGDTALAQLQFAHACLHHEAKTAPEAGYPAKADSTVSRCFRPLIVERDGRLRPWRLTYAPGAASAGGKGYSHYSLRLAQHAPSGKAFWSLLIDDAGVLRRAFDTLVVTDSTGLLNDLTGCHATRRLVAALRSLPVYPRSRFPTVIMVDLAGRRMAGDTLFLADTMFLNSERVADSTDGAFVMRFEQGALRYWPERDAPNTPPRKFRVEWQPQSSVAGLGTYALEEAVLIKSLRAYHASSRSDQIHAASALGVIRDALSDAPECQLRP